MKPTLELAIFANKSSATSICQTTQVAGTEGILATIFLQNARSTRLFFGNAAARSRNVKNVNITFAIHIANQVTKTVMLVISAVIQLLVLTAWEQGKL